MDTMFLIGRSVLHMVDEATHFCAAVFLKSQTMSTIWKDILLMWTLVYMGPTDHITVDQVSVYVSKEMKGYLDSSGVKIWGAPIEKPGAIGKVEIFHASLRTAYEKIKADMGRQM